MSDERKIAGAVKAKARAITFPSFDALYRAASWEKQLSWCAELTDVKDVVFKSSVHLSGEDVCFALQDESGFTHLRPTDYAWNQIASFCQAPMNLIRRLSSPTACRVLNETWQAAEWRPRQILVQDDGKEKKLRALTSAKYARVWDADVLDALASYTQEWVPVGEALNGRHPNREGLPGLWRDEKEMMLFLARAKPLDGSTGLGGLRQGLVLRNSECGAASLWVAPFLFTGLCGNMVVYGLKEAELKSFRHVGAVGDKWREALREALIASPDLASSILARSKAAAETPFVPSGAEAARRLEDEFHWSDGETYARAFDRAGMDRDMRPEDSFLMHRLTDRWQLPLSLSAEVIVEMDRPWNQAEATRPYSVWHVVQGLSSLQSEKPEDALFLATVAGRILDTVKAG